jgi:hypothetical protein
MMALNILMGKFRRGYYRGVDLTVINVYAFLSLFLGCFKTVYSINVDTNSRNIGQ